MICNWLIERMNESLQKSNSFNPEQAYISVIDIFGYNSSKRKQSSSEFITNIINEKLKQHFCTCIEKQSSCKLKYNDSCISLIQNIKNILGDQFHSPSNFDEFFNQLQKICLNHPFATINKEQETIECNHFFKNIVYDVRELFFYAQHSNIRILSRITSMLSNSLVRQNIFISNIQQQNLPQKTCTLFFDRVFHQFNDIFDCSYPHFICCIRPDQDNSLFSSSFVLQQLKAHGITKIVNHLMKTNQIPRKKSKSDISDDLDPVFPQSSNLRAKSSTNVSVTHQTPSKRSKSQTHKKKASIFGSLRKRKESSDIIDQDDLISVNVSYSAPIIPKSPKPSISTRLQRTPQLSLEPFDDLMPENENSDTDEFYNLSDDDLSQISNLSDDEDIYSSTYSSSIQSPHIKTIPVSSLPKQFAASDSVVKFRSSTDPFRGIQKKMYNQQQQNNPASIHVDKQYQQALIRKRADEFLFLYSCGSLLRTIYKEEDINQTSLNQIANNLRVSDAAVVSNFHSQFRGRSNSTEAMDAFAISGNSISDNNTNNEKDELLDEWKGLEQAEITPELANWERRSIRLRKHKQILPLLKLESGDAVINQINYHNTIRTTPRRQKSIM